MKGKESISNKSLGVAFQGYTPVFDAGLDPESAILVTRKKEKVKTENPATASFKLQLEHKDLQWIYGLLISQPEVQLIQPMEFPKPFSRFSYRALNNQGQIMLEARLEVTDEFKEKYNDSIGNEEDLQPLTKRYKGHQLIPDGKMMAVSDDGESVYGLISREFDGQTDCIVIRKGGPVGEIKLSEKTPVNDLSVQLENFQTLVQRYVSAIWRSNPEHDQRKLILTIGGADITRSAYKAVLSAYETTGAKFRENPRPIDLDGEIGGFDKEKDVIRGLVVDTVRPDLSRRFGVNPLRDKSVLITGPEGSGKTLFPKALYTELRKVFGSKLEYFRLPLSDVLTQYGYNSSTAVDSVLNHLFENEKEGIPSLLHLDRLDVLVTNHQLLESVMSSQTPHMLFGVSESELAYHMQTISPILVSIGNFGKTVIAESSNIIIIGESRLPRSYLPEAITKFFRRQMSLDNPSPETLAGIIRVQIETTRTYATKQNGEQSPFASDIDSKIEKIAACAPGLTGRDIRQSIVNAANRKKVAVTKDLQILSQIDSHSDFPQVTDDDIIRELALIRTLKGVQSPDSRKRSSLGYDLGQNRTS